MNRSRKKFVQSSQSIYIDDRGDLRKRSENSYRVKTAANVKTCLPASIAKPMKEALEVQQFVFQTETRQVYVIAFVIMVTLATLTV